MSGEIGKAGMGPEMLRTLLAQMRPADLGMGKAEDEVLERFQVKLLTEGSGTQIFSTTFANGRHAKPCAGPSHSLCSCASPHDSGSGR